MPKHIRNLRIATIIMSLSVMVQIVAVIIQVLKHA